MASASTSSSNSNTAATAADKAGAVKSGPCQVCKIPSSLQCGSCRNVFYCSAQHQKQDWKGHKKGGGCSPLRKAQDDKQGRYWVAARNIKAGELILKELPAIVSPDVTGDNASFCVSCCTELLPPGGQLPEGIHHPKERIKMMAAIQKSCRKCGWPVCGEDCEKLKVILSQSNCENCKCLILIQAPIHANNECPIFASRPVKFPVSPPASLPFGLEDKFRKGHMYTCGIRLIRGILLKRNDPTTWNKIMDLQQKTNKRAEFARSDLEKEIISCLPSIITQAVHQKFKVADLAPVEDWVRLQRTLDSNQFAFKRCEAGRLLNSPISALYLQGSLFHHSCTPNAFRNISYPPAFELQIRAATDIKKGEMVTLNYYAETMLYGTERRLKKTALSSGFVCQCARCLDPTELGAYSSAIICDRCPEKGIMLPTTFQNSDEPYRCQTPGCQNTKSRSYVSDLISTLHREISPTETLSWIGHDLTTDAAKLEKFISRLSGKVLYPNHWLLLEAEQAYMCACEDTFATNAEHLARCLLYSKRRVGFFFATSPGINVERVQFQIRPIKYLMKHEQTLSQGEAKDCWAEIHKLATDSLKYWQMDVQYTPPGKEMSEEGTVMKTIQKFANDQLSECR